MNVIDSKVEHDVFRKAVSTFRHHALNPRSFQAASSAARGAPAARRAARCRALSMAPVLATPLPTMSKAVPCAGVVKIVCEAAGYRDAAVEARAAWSRSGPGRDTSTRPRRTHPLQGADVERIRRERAAAVDAGGRHLSDRRRDHVDLLAAEQPAFAAMRIEGGDGDARSGDAGPPHHAVGQDDRILDALRRDLVERLAQRDMRGDARHPLVVEHVHLGEVALVVEEMGEHLVLVRVVPAAGMQGRLVEGREGDGVHLAAFAPAR